MSLLTSIRLVAIDTALLNHLATDFTSEERKQRVRAKETLEDLFETGWIPVVTGHHVIEMIQHRDEAVAAKRVAFLKSLPHLAWVGTKDRTYNLGTVLDLFAHEILALVKLPDCRLDALQSFVRANLLQFGPLGELPILECWRDIRPILFDNMARQQEVASILRVDSDEKKNESLQVLENARLRRPDQAEKVLHRMTRDLTAALATHGDMRIENPASTSSAFFDQVVTAFERAKHVEGNCMDMFLEASGLNRGDLSSGTTLGEICDLATLKKKTELACELVGLELSDVWPTVRSAKVPSIKVQQAIRVARRTATRASGSDLGDDYLASFCPYLDAVVVDKRTHEYIRQVRQKEPDIGPLVRSATRTTSYMRLLSVLE